MNRVELTYSVRTLKNDVDGIPAEYRVSDGMIAVFGSLLRLAQAELPEHPILSALTLPDMRSHQHVATLRVLAGQLLSVLES